MHCMYEECASCMVKGTLGVWKVIMHITSMLKILEAVAWCHAIDWHLFRPMNGRICLSGFHVLFLVYKHGLLVRIYDGILCNLLIVFTRSLVCIDCTVALFELTNKYNLLCRVDIGLIHQTTFNSVHVCVWFYMLSRLLPTVTMSVQNRISKNLNIRNFR